MLQPTLSAPTVFSADDANGEAGDTRPQPPLPTGVAQRVAKQQQQTKSGEPQSRADGHGARTRDVEWLDLCSGSGLARHGDPLYDPESTFEPGMSSG